MKTKFNFSQLGGGKILYGLKNSSFFKIASLMIVCGLVLYSCLKENTKQEAISTKQVNAVVRAAADFCAPATSEGCFVTSRTGIPVAYQGCGIISCNYTLTKCNNPLKISISNLTYTFPSPMTAGCNTLVNNWKNLLNTGQYTALYNSYNAFYKSVSMQLEAFELTLQINNVASCNLPIPLTTTVEWFETGCKRLCYNEEAGLFEVLCGEGCCLRTTKYCKDANNNLIKQPSQITALKPCGPIIPNSCGGEPGTPCNPACAKL